MKILFTFSKRIVNGNYYFIWLILFFIIHSWANSVYLVSGYTILKIFLTLLVLGIILFLIFLFGFRNKDKAALVTGASLFFSLFYFGIQDLSVFLSRAGLYINPRFFLCGLLVMTFIVVLISSEISSQLKRYFNIVLLLLCVFESFNLVTDSYRQTERPVNSFIKEYSMKVKEGMPSVYFVILDEYTGSEMLQKYFNYDNHYFLQELGQMGFHIVKDARSNYSYTLLSVASILNGEYIMPKARRSVYDNEMYYSVLRSIKNNRTFKSFAELGYTNYNYSPFKINEQQPLFANSYLPQEFSLVLHNTIFNEIIELFPFFVARRMGNKKYLKQLFSERVSENYKIIQEVLKQSLVNSPSPAFSYIHLMMPHSPFAVDSSGRINVDFLTSKVVVYEEMKDAYLQYLIYTNKVVTKFVKELKENTKGESVIVLISDHGIRGLSQSNDANIQFNSLNVLYYPHKDSIGLYSGVSNVNLFRVLFSEIIGKKIQLLADSIVVK